MHSAVSLAWNHGQPERSASRVCTDSELRRLCSGQGYGGQISIGETGFSVVEPVVVNRLAVGIMALACVQGDALADIYVHLDDVCAAFAVYDSHGIMVGVFVVGCSPGHARGEVVLEGFAPAPDGGLI